MHQRRLVHDTMSLGSRRRLKQTERKTNLDSEIERVAKANTARSVGSGERQARSERCSVGFSLPLRLLGPSASKHGNH